MRALKSLPEVAQSLKIKVLLDGQDGELAAPLLLNWLEPRCRVCHGTALQPNSERGCGKCREHPGLAAAPGGEQGRAILQWLDSVARNSGWEVKAYCKG